MRTKVVKRKGKWKQFIPVYLMMLPGLLYLFINNYMPMAGLVVAFKQVNFSTGIWKSPWVGLKNFEFLFTTVQSGIHCNRNRAGNFSGNTDYRGGK